MTIENRAPIAATYLNRQLETHWINNCTYAKKYGSHLKPTSPHVEFGTCLAEYYHGFSHNKKNPSKEDMSFYASFGTPRLEFICNHNAVLYLDLKEGHFNHDTRTITPKA